MGLVQESCVEKKKGIIVSTVFIIYILSPVYIHFKTHTYQVRDEPQWGVSTTVHSKIQSTNYHSILDAINVTAAMCVVMIVISFARISSYIDNCE